MKNVKLTDLEVAQHFANKARNDEPYCAPMVVEFGTSEYYGEMEDGGYAEGHFFTTDMKKKDYTEKGLFFASDKESALIHGQRVYNDGTVLSIGCTPVVQKRGNGTTTLYGENWTGYKIYDDRESDIHIEGYSFCSQWITCKKIGPGNTCYEGEYKDGSPHGKGVFTSADGTRHEGIWRAGKLNGDVKVTKTDGTVWKYVFIDGKPISHTKIEQEQEQQ